MNNSIIDFAWCLNFFEKRGKELFGEKFRIYQDDHEMIYKILIYFLRLESEAENYDIDLNKGLLVTGPIGCGKTSLMTLMRSVPAPEFTYVVKPCRDVSFDFIQDGYEVINRYSRFSFSGQFAKGYCFDDLGAEQSLKYFGNECNVMAEILLSRYELFVSQKMITHVTTNLSASELESLYGNRVRSRMREMFNLVSFDGVTGDKRT